MAFQPLCRALALASLSCVPYQALLAQDAPDPAASDTEEADPILTDTIVVSALRPDRARRLSEDNLAMPEQIALPADATAIGTRWTRRFTSRLRS